MKTLDELRALYVAALNVVWEGDVAHKQTVVDNLSAMSAHCKEAYEVSSVIDKARWRVQYESFDAIVRIVEQAGLFDPRVSAFFGLIESSAAAPSYADVVRGKGIVTAPDMPPMPEKVRKADIPPASAPDIPRKAEARKADVPPVSETAGGVSAVSPAPAVRNGKPKFVPECLDDFIGQAPVVRRIKEAISAARKRGEKHIDNILLFGNRGLGKTTLMELIAKELGVEFEFMDASQFENGVRSVRIMQKFFQRISENDRPVVIAIDEIHALPKNIQTGLLTLLNSRKFAYMDDNGVNHEFPIREFTFIGATTDAQDVLATIKDRCSRLTFYLQDYTPEELTQIFRNKFAAKELSAGEDVIAMCVARCRSSLREAKAFVEGLDDKALTADTRTVTVQMANALFDELGCDAIGLKQMDRDILEAIRETPTGVISEETLAARLHLDPRILTKEFEPYLIKIGFISITNRGRSLTQKAIDYLRFGVLPESPAPPSDVPSEPAPAACDEAPVVRPLPLPSDTSNTTV